MDSNRKATEINDAVPSSISHLVGQKQVIAQVKTAMDAAFEDGTRFEHALLVGGPGLGKSQFASVIAQEMATEFHEVLGQSIKGIGDLNALLLEAKDKDIIHIDECHELDKQFQTALYLAIDKQKHLRQQQAVATADSHCGLYALALQHDRRILPAATVAGPDETDLAV